jgi:hypothetical protein
MVPAMVQRTLTGNIMAMFHKCVEESQDEEAEAHTMNDDFCGTLSLHRVANAS